MAVRVGVSGWRYPHWRHGAFYPEGLPQRRELEHVATCLGAVEINGSFYSLQRPESYARWRAEAPDGFVFAVKGGRFITHMKKLAGVETALANFFASGLLALTDQLGPVLWQLPPMLGFDPGRLGAFFDQLPRTCGDAAVLARTHDARLDGRSLTETDLPERPVQHVLEVRHASYVTPAFVELLRAHDVGLVVADTAGRAPLLVDVTAGVVYVRLHGHTELYLSDYDDQQLDGWAARIRTWAAGGTPAGAIAPHADARPRDVYVFFDNDGHARAPRNALALQRRLAEQLGGVDASRPPGGTSRASPGRPPSYFFSRSNMAPACDGPSRSSS